MNMIKVADAAKMYGVKSSQIHTARMNGFIPEWMEKKGSSWYVDDGSNGFHLHLKSKIKKANSAKFGHLRAKRKVKKEDHKLNILSMDETEKLQEFSIQAELSKPITNLRLEQYKIEAQKLKLEQQAGDLISRSMGDFLYTGYLERLSRELLTYHNKLETDFDHKVSNLIVRIRDGEDVVSADVAKELKALIVNETEDIIRVVKHSQAEALQKWATEAGVQL